MSGRGVRRPIFRKPQLSPGADLDPTGMRLNMGRLASGHLVAFLVLSGSRRSCGMGCQKPAEALAGVRMSERTSSPCICPSLAALDRIAPCQAPPRGAHPLCGQSAPDRADFLQEPAVVAGSFPPNQKTRSSVTSGSCATANGMRHCGVRTIPGRKILQRPPKADLKAGRIRRSGKLTLQNQENRICLCLQARELLCEWCPSPINR